METTPTETQADLLDRAAEILDEKGWHKGSLIDSETGAICGWGAVAAAVREDVSDDSSPFGLPYEPVPRCMFFDTVNTFERINGITLPRLNDRPWTTKHRVQRKLRATAATLRRTA